MKKTLITLLLGLASTISLAADEVPPHPYVEIVTTKGTIILELNGEQAPLTVGHFLRLVDDGFYDGIIFHRVIPGFMAQGGDPTGTGRGGPGYRFDDELPARGRYEIGSLAMANSGPNTNGSQFFICHTDAGLPHSYTIFGKVTSGWEAVDSIATTATDRGDRPPDDVVISKVTIDES